MARRKGMQNAALSKGPLPKILRRRVQAPPVPFKLPWDFRYGETFAVFPSLREIEVRPGSGCTEEQHAMDIAMSGVYVFTLEQIESFLQFKIDPNWHDEHVDWRPHSLQQVVDGTAQAPDLSPLFRRVKGNIEYFVDLPSMGGCPPEVVAEFLSCWTVGTYCMLIWDAYGYLHFDSAFEDCGKSRAGRVVSWMSFWPVDLSANSTLPEWRDTSHFGRTQFLDDVPNLGDLPAEARGMLNVGYKRGAKVRLKRLDATQGWVGSEVDVFAPRIFAAVATMDAMLRSRSFRIVMRRTTNAALTQRDPYRVPWPYDPAGVKDDMYLWSFLNMGNVAGRYRDSRMDVLMGRSHEIARPILTIASLIEEAGEQGLFDHIKALLEEMDRESVRDRGQRSGYADLVLAAWRCYQKGIQAPTADEVAGRMPHAKSAIQIGRELTGAPWVRRTPTVRGSKHYAIDEGILAKEMAALGIADTVDAAQASTAADKKPASVGEDGGDSEDDS